MRLSGGPSYPADRQRSALSRWLWLAQKAVMGWLSRAGHCAEVADALEMPYSESHEVATFTDVRMQLWGKFHTSLAARQPCMRAAPESF